MTSETEIDPLDALLRGLESGERLGVRIVQHPETGATARFPRTMTNMDEWEAASVAMHERQAEAVAALAEAAGNEESAAESFGRFQVARV